MPAPVRDAQVRPVLLSIEPWDMVWRRNQQLASRVPGTIFVEPGRLGLRSGCRREGLTDVVTPAKPLPFRLPGGRRLHARLAARAVRRASGADHLVTWATHPYQLEMVEAMGAHMLYDRTDDWPEMESDAAAQREVARRERRMLERAGTVVVVSEAMRNQVREGAELVPNGVDLKLFKPVEYPSHRGGPLRVAFAGTLDPWRLDVDMLRSLVDAGAQLLLIGPGRLDLEAEQTGPLPPAVVAARLAECNALVAPYREDLVANRTSDALKLYEYFATGLPVIASMTAGFERYRDLVIPWPVSGALAHRVEENRAHRDSRIAVALAASWERRAARMQVLLAEIA